MRKGRNGRTFFRNWGLTFRPAAFIIGKMKIGSAKKIAVLALLTGLALIAFLLESLFVAPAFPAAKPGLSNFFTLFALLLYGLPEALFVVVARTVLGALFAGNLSMLLYSLTAGVVSAIVSRLLLFAFPRISVVCVSVVSATVHNLVQLGVSCLLLVCLYVGLLFVSRR